MSLPHFHCPGCKRELWDDHAKFTPAPGLITICLYCTQIMEWTSTTQSRGIEAVDISDTQLREQMTAAQYLAKRMCMYCYRSIKACKQAGECKR